MQSVKLILLLILTPIFLSVSLAVLPPRFVLKSNSTYITFLFTYHNRSIPGPIKGMILGCHEEYYYLTKEPRIPKEFRTTISKIDSCWGYILGYKTSNTSELNITYPIVDVVLYRLSINKAKLRLIVYSKYLNRTFISKPIDVHLGLILDAPIYTVELSDNGSMVFLKKNTDALIL